MATNLYDEHGLEINWVHFDPASFVLHEQYLFNLIDIVPIEGLYETRLSGSAVDMQQWGYFISFAVRFICVRVENAINFFSECDITYQNLIFLLRIWIISQFELFFLRF